MPLTDAQREAVGPLSLYDPNEAVSYKPRPRSTLLPNPTQSTRAYLDFVGGLKIYTQRHLTLAVRQEFERRAAAVGQAPETADAAQALLEGAPVYGFQQLLLHQSQEMMWGGSIAQLQPAADTIKALLETPVAGPLGSLTLDPDLVMPRYFVEHDIHLQPGAYPNDPLAGPVYEVGAAIYNSRPDYDNQPERLFASGLPEDPRSPPRAVLDLGCGTGKSTWYIADRFLHKGAEIHAVDLSAPMCRYAHRRNEELGLPIHVRQASADRLPYADESFDLVTAKILFHEIPRPVAEGTIREALRVLRAGGFFVIGDIKGYQHADSFMRMAGDWQVRHNGEPFWRETLTMNFVESFRAAGFAEVQEGPNPADELAGFPWLTVGRKAR